MTRATGALGRGAGSAGGAGGTRVEVNLVRLLARCELLMSGSDAPAPDWRLTKYVETLGEYLAQLRTQAANAPSPESLADYTRRVELLRGILRASKLPTANEKALAVESLVSGSGAGGGGGGGGGSRVVHQQTRARYQRDAREELMGSEPQEWVGGEVRQRGEGGEGGGEWDVLLQQQRAQQARLADEMLALARSLKENARAAGNIVRSDHTKLVESARQADSNSVRLRVEGARLQQHVARACSCWLLLLLAAVVVVFVWMVVFMRLFSKK